MPPKKVHLLTQYAWPDSAPTGILAEQLADRLTASAVSVVLVTGSGSYRESTRVQPSTPIVRLDHFRGKRGRLGSTAWEYLAVGRAFSTYIRSHVRAGDLVIVTSAPPNTIRLIRAIRSVNAIGIYWLQDYYPELFRTIIDPPRPLRWLFSRSWDRWLGRWHHVVKAAGNLGYGGANARVIRNWPTLALVDVQPGTDSSKPRTALYTGNLGYCHDIPSFIRTCRELHDQGHRITVRGDGPGIAQLPDWIDAGPQFPTERDLAEALAQADIHLVAGHPKYQHAVFPSKFWNSHLTGREIVLSGFEGAMLDELAAARQSSYNEHLEHWRAFLTELTKD